MASGKRTTKLFAMLANCIGSFLIVAPARAMNQTIAATDHMPYMIMLLLFFQLKKVVVLNKKRKAGGTKSEVSLVYKAHKKNNPCKNKNVYFSFWRNSMEAIMYAKINTAIKVSFRPGIHATAWLNTG